jgi:hypothetical protein
MPRRRKTNWYILGYHLAEIFLIVMIAFLLYVAFCSMIGYKWW